MIYSQIFPCSIFETHKEMWSFLCLLIQKFFWDVFLGRIFFAQSHLHVRKVAFFIVYMVHCVFSRRGFLSNTCLKRYFEQGFFRLKRSYVEVTFHIVVFPIIFVSFFENWNKNAQLSTLCLAFISSVLCFIWEFWYDLRQ